MTEFDIIREFFTKQPCQRTDVALGIGDDAAVITPPLQHQLVVTTDTLIADVHFPLTAEAFDVGFKSLAVNLSDLAAMGATPFGVTLALTLPHADENWLRDFANGFFTLAKQYNVQLIGGDTTRGLHSITVQALGWIPNGMAITRSGAKPGDLIYVTHTLGDAAYALAHKEIPETQQALHRPEPCVAIGEALRGVAHAAIDVSDGLLADLNHILTQSKVGARIDVNTIPLSKTLRTLPLDDALKYALNGGDDYELCFTVAKDQAHQVPEHCTCIGEITTDTSLDLRYTDGTLCTIPINGYRHF